MATLKNPNIFKGILQYKSTDNFTKETGYMYLIRGFNENGEETGKTEIYFGNRKYGEANVSQTGGLDSILEEINKLAQETANSKPVTYSELKSLRDNGNLIPGQKYRIIDYITTVNKQNISSAGHPFNIIVEALNENTLSEQAKAIQDENDEYFDSENLSAWQLWYCLDNDESRFEWANGKVDWKAEFIGYYWNDPTNGEEYGDSTSLDSDKIYDWGIDYDPELDDDNIVIYKSDVEIYEEEGEADYTDKFFYRGVVTIDGQEYDSWKKYEESDGWVTNENEETKFKYALTERLVFDGEIIWPESADEEMGKGVIYRMIDEYGNDCPYDFKNIMFKRPNAEDIGDDNYYFTFSWVEEGGNIMDASIYGNNGYLLNDAPEIPGVFSNVIGKYIENGVNKLPVNTFIGNYNYDKGWYYGCRNNTLGNSCHNNIFGDDCHNNSFGNNCYNNTFGEYCYNNTFGDYCDNNTFGDICHSNTFTNECSTNTFGDSCHHNTFANNCSYNIFVFSCFHNTFANSCYNNTFGNSCDYNTFSNRCHHNTFGNGCHHNTFINECSTNTFGDYCSHNTFGNGCDNNTFANSCQNNTFANSCYYNTFGYNCNDNTFINKCSFNTFGNSCYNNTFGNNCKKNSFRIDATIDSDLLNYCKNIHISDDCSYNVIYHSEQPTSNSSHLQNINIIKGVYGTNDAYNFISIDTLAADYEIKVAKNSSGELKIYCEADLIA